MKNKEERIKEFENEEFYFGFFNGTYMPNNKKYIRINMFNDIFYIENELQVKEYPDIYFILKTKEIIRNNIQKIKIMSETMNANNNSRNSHYCEFILKIDNQLYKINKNICNDEGKKLFDEFSMYIYKVLGINNEMDRDNLVNALKNWKQNNTSDNLKKLIQYIINYSFYCATKDNNGSQMIATIKNANGDTLLPAFSSKEQLYKWIKISDNEIKKLTFDKYADILLSESNCNIGIVIDPFDSNIVLDKKIVNDILKANL